MCWEIYLRCATQNKQADGKRRSRWVVVRNTKEQLRDTTLRTWLDWFPDTVMGTYAVSDMTYKLRYNDIEADILFRALDKPDDVKKLLSLELTGAFVNEAREVPWAIVNGLTGRVGRYPRKADGGSNWNGIIMDTNPPDEDHWWFKKFEVDMYADPQVADLYKCFYQPPGVIKDENHRWITNPDAENIANLPDSYYPNMVVGKDPEWIKVYAEGKYGIVSDGRPVYSGYNDAVHCYEFEVDPRLPVYVGWDYSFLGQACVLAQVSLRGQLRIFREFIGSDTGIGLYSFVMDAVKPGLAEFGELNFVSSTGDPAGAKHGDLDEKFALEMLNDGYQDMICRLPFRTEPADTNSLAPRLEGVNHFLNRMIDGAPAFLLHPRCQTLRKGFMGRYEFGRVQVVGEERYKDMPKKNKFSHPQDALQYLCRGVLCDVQESEYRVPRKRAVSSYSGY